MPKIDQQIIESVFYLYADRKSAEAGINPGGTGFVVAYEDSFSGYHYYGVTNKHVACTNGISVIRLNTFDSTEILDFDPADWDCHPEGDDIAIIPLTLDPLRIHQVSAIHTGMFVREHGHDIGVGDDVFMVGLFVDQEGKERNNPLARFGNLSMLANKNSLIQQGKNNYEGYIVDMHSRSGFSGSPVFVYRTFGTNLSRINFGETVSVDAENIANQLRGRDIDRLGEMDILLRPYTMLQFLGIHWGQYTEKWELEGLKNIIAESESKYLITDKTYVTGFSGMTCVAPAWRIFQILEQQKLIKQRKPA